jgi:hypothetical protein
MPGAIELPLPGAGAPMLDSVAAREDALQNWQDTTATTSLDPYQQTKAQSYGAGMDHAKFERYYNMSGVYKKLGFNPFRDNETAYNEESNIFDEVGRASGQWANLAGIGLVDAMGFGSLTDGDVAKKFAKATNIGSSTKGGVGGFMTNLYLNSGYSMGIMAEVVAEEVALGLITGATLGSASGLTVPAMTARGLRASNKLYKGFNASKNLIRSLEALKDVNKAKKYFSQTLKKGGNFLNPLENTVDFVNGIDHLKDAAGNPLGKLAKTTLGFAGFYKDVRNIRYAWGESGLEGGMVKNEMEENLLAEHYDKHDRPPTTEEAQDIKETALRAGSTTGWQGVGAIYFSNKIVFDGLFNAYTPLKNMARNKGAGMFKTVQTKKVTGEVFETVENNWKQTLKEFKDPRKTLAVGLTYFSDNVAEGLQESVQETISGAAKDYYTEKWRGNAMKGGYFASITDNLQKQATPEGLEVFMSGFLMGGMMGSMTTTLGSFVPGSTAQSYLKSKWSQFRDPADYADMRTKAEDSMNKTTNMMNELWNNSKQYLAPNLEELERQNEYAAGRKETQENGDAKGYYDLKNAAETDHVITALQLGRFDTFVDRLKDLKNVSAEDIEKEYSVSKQQYDTEVDKSIANAKRIEARYEMVQKEYENPFNPGNFSAEHDREAFDAEQQNFNGWADAQRKFVFLQNSFDHSLSRFSSIMGEAQADAQLAKVATTDFTNLFHIGTMVEEIARLNIEAKALSEATAPESKALYKKKTKKAELLTKFTNSMENVKVQKTVDGSLTSLDKEDPGVQTFLKEAQAAYKEYLTFLAEANGDYAFDNAINNSFEKLVDAYMLNEDSARLNKAINIMIDPGEFTRQAANVSQIRGMRAAQFQKEIKESLEAYKKAVEGNLLLEGIFELGMFFDHVQFEELLRSGTLPERFQLFYVKSDKGSDTQPVQINSEDYTKAMNVILGFVPEIMGIPLSKTQMARAKDIYNSEARPKSEKDKRTYADLAKQYGFTSTAKETKVLLKDVLLAVSKSKYATKSEKELAKQLHKRASDGEYVTFVNDADNPGTYTPTTQSKIDARYSDSNHEGANLPIEFVILHTEIQRRTSEELKNDPTFNNEMTALYDAAQAHYKTNKAEDESARYGLNSLEDFISETMINPRFQEWLATVPYAATGKSSWATFVDSVLKMLAKFFKPNKMNAANALNEALHVITAKIDKTYGIKDKKVNKTKPGKTKSDVKITDANTKLTNAIPMAKLREDHPEFAAQILAVYVSYQGNKASTATFPFKDPDYKKKKGNAAYEAQQFINFYESSIPAIKLLFKEYNEAKERTEDPILKAKSTGNIGEAVRTRLDEKGYTPEEIDELAKNVGLAVEIANRKGDKAVHEAAEARTKASDEQINVTRRGELMALVNSFIADATTLDELEAAEKIIINDVLGAPAFQNMANSPDGWALLDVVAEEFGKTSITDVLQKMLDDRKKAIAFNVDILDIAVGGTIILKNGRTKMIVDSVNTTKNTMMAHTATKPNIIKEVNLKDVKFTRANVKTAEVATSDLSAADNALQAASDDAVDSLDDSLDDDLNNTDEDGNLNPCGSK